MTKTGYKRLSPTEIDMACKMYASGQYSLRDLGDRFGVCLEAIRRNLKRRGVAINPPHKPLSRSRT